MIRELFALAVSLSSSAIVGDYLLTDHQPEKYTGDLPGYDHLAAPLLADRGSELARRSDERPAEFAVRMTQTVHRSTYHCTPTDVDLSLIEQGMTSVFEAFGQSPHFNLGMFDPENMVCGFCSERAQALTSILNENGVEAITFGLGGHVVTKLTIDGVPYFADPDYGAGVYPAQVGRAELTRIYQASTVNGNVGHVVDMISNHEDGSEYYSQPFFEEVTNLRNKFFLIADLIAACFVLFAGCATLWLVKMAKKKRSLPPA